MERVQVMASRDPYAGSGGHFSDVLSVVSLLVAVVTAGISIYTFRASRAKWHVAVSTLTLISSTGAPPRSVVVVTVTNTGRASGTIQRVRVQATDGSYGVNFMSKMSHAVKGSALPLTLAPTEQMEWYYDLGVMRAALERQARTEAPMLTATVKSGLSEHVSDDEVKVGLLPSPKPRSRGPRWLRRGRRRLRSLLRSGRAARPLLVGTVFINTSVLKRGEWPLEVRNFGKATARNLRVEMIGVKDGKETLVDDVPARELRKLKPGKSHVFLYPLSHGTRADEPGVAFWWRLTVDGRSGGQRVGVTSKATVDEILEQYGEAAESTDAVSVPVRADGAV